MKLQCLVVAILLPLGSCGPRQEAQQPADNKEAPVLPQPSTPPAVALPDAAPIPAEYMTEFQARAGSLLAQLDRARDATVAAAPTN